MITVVRSPRNIDFQAINTPADIGPGYYEVPAGGARKLGTPSSNSYAPFMSLDEKKLNENRTTSAITPGPGSYREAPSPKPKVYESDIPSNAFATKVPRFAPVAPGSSVYKSSTIVDNPGPGSYSTDAQWTREERRSQDSHPHPSLTVHPNATSPSIPTRANTAARNGQQVRQTHSGTGIDTVGPGSYDPRIDAIRHVPSPADFGRSKAERRIFEPTNRSHNYLPPFDNPGPGQYQHGKDGHPIPLAPSRPFASKVQQAHQIDDAKLHPVPGPGHYIESEVDIHRVYKVENAGVQNFGSSVPREGWDRNPMLPFTNQKAATPGPGTYHHRTRTNASSLASAISVPFHSTDSRDCLKRLEVTDQPGPGSYENPFDMAERIRSKTPTGVFGSTTERVSSVGGGSAMSMHTPGPGSYSHSLQSAPTHSSMFVSRSRRFYKGTTSKPFCTLVGYDRKPPPGAYEVTQPILRPKTVPIGTERASFDSSTARFQSGYLFVGQPVPATPGPGSYAANPTKIQRAFSKFHNPKPSFISQSERFKTDMGNYRNRPTTGDMIGPGSYKSLKPFGKKSFNITLDSRIEPDTKLHSKRPSPSETPQPSFPQPVL
eukprot:GILK01004488.1.p1 GENE.GILK01004488.1~~GILK01004488.1.p1  ORF type:complete len:602 (-),score=58.48 GILK01004488.1:151-1956(-)